MAKTDDFDFYCEVALKRGTKIDIVFENEFVLAFHHTKPAYEKHVVIIPKHHIHDFRSLQSPDLIAHLTSTAQLVLNNWGDEYISNYGARVISNLGAFQDTPHLHFHIIGGKKL